MNCALETALKYAEKFKGCKYITYRGEMFPCSVGDEIAKATLEWGGFTQTIDQVVNVRKSVFSDGIFPTNKEPITLNNTIYLVENVATDGTDTFIQIALKKK